MKIISFNTADHHNTHSSLSSHENTLNKKDENKKDENKKDENKKENAAFEHSRDQRILTAKQQRPSNPTKNENKTNKDHQVTGNQVFLALFSYLDRVGKWARVLIFSVCHGRTITAFTLILNCYDSYGYSEGNKIIQAIETKDELGRI